MSDDNVIDLAAYKWQDNWEEVYTESNGYVSLQVFVNKKTGELDIRMESSEEVMRKELARLDSKNLLEALTAALKNSR